MKTAKSALGALCVAGAITGCVSATDALSAPAPEAFTNCMRHFTDDNLTGPDASAALQVCDPFVDEENEAVQRLADKHFRR